MTLSGQLGLAQLGAAELGQFETASVTPPVPPPLVVMSATSGQAFGDEETERKPVVVAKPLKPKKKKRKKKKPAELPQVVPQVEAAKPDLESLTEALAEFEKQRYAHLIQEIERSEREQLAEEDELVLLGCFR